MAKLTKLTGAGREGVPTKSPSLHEMFEVIRRDPTFRIDMMFSRFADTKNPYYVWRTVETCIKHGRAFPDWVITYLGECAERMRSADAVNARDVRKVLPWILGFAMARGPGSPLNPDSVPIDRFSFAIRFSTKIEEGEKPSVALKSACEVLDATRADSIDEKTLRRWLCEEFNLKKFPRTSAEWKEIARAKYSGFYQRVRERFREIAP